MRDGDGIYGERVRRRIDSLGIDEVVTAPASPWQNPYVERVIGSLRRELLNHVIILNEPSQAPSIVVSGLLPFVANAPVLGPGCTASRPVQSADSGKVIEFPVVHGLHHYYLPKAA